MQATEQTTTPNTEKEWKILNHLAEIAADIENQINELNINETGYRIISNSGINGGQEVPHFHIHILAGEKIGSLR